MLVLGFQIPSPANLLEPDMRFLSLPIVVLLCLGCGGGGKLGELVTVKGKVTLDGVPLTAGSVRFVPDKDQGNTGTHEPVSEIGADGTYSLTTVDKSGAPLGWYKVTVSPKLTIDSSKPFAQKSPFPTKFSSAEHTPIKIEVVKSPGADAYEIKVTSK
jgi:hypothetical protein